MLKILVSNNKYTCSNVITDSSGAPFPLDTSLHWRDNKIVRLRLVPTNTPSEPYSTVTWPLLVPRRVTVRLVCFCLRLFTVTVVYQHLHHLTPSPLSSFTITFISTFIVIVVYHTINTVYYPPPLLLRSYLLYI